MGTRYRPSGIIEIGGMPAFYGYLAQPPQAFLVTAQELNDQDGNSVEAGRYHQESGELRGVAEFARQDTYIDGTAGRTGIAFDDITGGGVITDNFKDPVHNTYGIFFPDSAPGTEYEIVSTNPFSEGIPHCEILLGRGGPGVSGTDSNYKPAQCYTKITFGFGNTYQYQLRFAYNSLASLAFSKDGGSSWLLPVSKREIGSLQTLLKQYSDFIPLKVYMDRANEVLHVEIGNGKVLRYGLPRDLTGEMLREGYLRVQTKNGWASFNIWPARHQSIAATVRGREFGQPVTNLGSAVYAINAAGVVPEGQETTVTPVVNGNEIGLTLEASIEDAGDGLGSIEAPRFSDLTLLTEGVWTQDIDGMPDFRTATGAYKQRVESALFDPVSRMFRQQAQICLSNSNGALNDLVGDLAVKIYGSNGSGYFPRMTGVARNPRFTRADPTRLYWMSVYDKMHLLEKGIGQRLRFDRWCVFSAVRRVAEVCGIHPRFLWRIPYYPPGPAGTDCPYRVLGSGLGNNPRHEYEPNVWGIAILLELVQQMNEIHPVSGRVIPYYTGFNADGDMLFEPMDLFDRLPKWAFSDLDPSGQGQIYGQIDWRVSTDDLRTDIILQGLDANTNDLLHLQRQVSVQARRMRGTRVTLWDRNPLYVSLGQMEDAAALQAILASIPELTGAFRAPLQEHLTAGDVVWVTDYFHGVQNLFVIERMKAVSGARDVTGLSAEAGRMDCYADYMVRALFNYF